MSLPPEQRQNDRLMHCALQHLRPSQLALAACESLGIETVGEFLALDRSKFLALPKFGERSYRALEAKVRAYLGAKATRPDSSHAEDLGRALNGLIHNPRALRAFVRLGIKTIGDFLATPREELLAVPGFGDRTYEEVANRVHALLGTSSNHLLPACLLDFKLYDLGLEDKLNDSLSRLGLVTVNDALRLPKDFLKNEPGVGTDGLEGIRQALDRMLRVGVSQVAGYGIVDLDTFSGFLGQILGILDQGQRELIKHRVGLGCNAQSTRKLATCWRITEEQLQLREGILRRTMQERVPAHMMELKRATEAELRAFEGIITGDRMATGSILHSCAKESRDIKLPLRLVAFLFPGEFHFGGEFLSGMPARLLNKLKQCLLRCTEDQNLPVSLETLEEKVRDTVTQVPRELLLHLLQDHLQLSLQIDPKLGEIITRRQGSIADRLQSIMEDLESPLQLEDLHFHFRDRFRACRKHRLLDQMRNDRRFLELEQDLWSLRERHLDELELLRAEAERISIEIQSSGKRLSSFELAGLEPGSDRAAFLLTDHLRRDPALRYLGRGEFVSRQVEHSSLVSGLVEMLQDAMGEIPFSRFLQNQTADRRRLISSILYRNRLFISPVKDRIDLLENYPFNKDRLARLLRATDSCLEQNHGYSQLEDLRQAVEEAGLGGAWLKNHLFLDLLRRHGHYEFLPGEMVAHANLGLMGWIQQRARDALRICDQPMTADEVLAERPDLAEFRTSLAQLLEQDPLVQTADGLYFTVT